MSNKLAIGKGISVAASEASGASAPALTATDIRLGENLPRRFLRMCRQAGRRSKAADSTGMDLTGQELLLRTLLLRRLLRRHVLASGEETVGVLLPPCVPSVLVNAALTLDRRVVVNLNYTLTAELLNQACLAQAGVRHVITSQKMLERFPLQLDAEMVLLEQLREKITPADKLLAYLEARWMPVCLLERFLGLHRIQWDDLMTIIFTSGSTGQPKGAMLTHGNIGANIEAFQQVLSLRASDVLVGVLPFFHSFGYTVTLWTVLSLAPKGIYHTSPLEPRAIGDLCRRHGATVLISTPTFLRNYLRRCEPEDFKTLDLIILGAEAMPRDLADAFEQKFGVRPVEGYGTTELSPVVSVNIPPGREVPGREAGLREGTVGRPLPGVWAKVLDEQTGEELPTGRQGMLWIRGPNVMKGYLNQPEQTAQVLQNGWYQTGDLAILDPDGFIRITGRRSRFSKIGGEMVPHLRVEEVLRQVLQLEDAENPCLAVTGLPHPTKGEQLVVLHTGLPKPPEEICQQLTQAGLPPLWTPSPENFRQVEQIPILSTGKLDLQALAQLAEELFSPTATLPSERPTGSAVPPEDGAA
ncbi:MAG TPA: AMP-binding protein [Thermoguttaceae bacterium]|nr:AMP-binding protein [Thermoguttaceae bacterium]